jgi:type I restriction enzyme S subunit
MLVSRTLGEVCDEVGGIIRTGPFGSQLHESDYSAEGTPVVMPKDIVEGRVSIASIARVDDTHVARLSQHQLAPGEIVYGRRGDIGRQALVTEREAGWLCGTGCLRISLGDRVLNPAFLHYYLRQPSVIGWISNQAIGATLPNLNTSILRSVPVRYPPLSVQRKIAAILSAYDDLIENNARRIAILEEMARSLYREWFVDLRFPGHESIAMVDSPIGQVPEGWRLAKVAEAAVIARGRSYTGEQLVDEGGRPFLNLKCIDRDGGFRPDGIKRYLGPHKDSQTATNGDIIMAVTDMTQERRIVAWAARVPRLEEDPAVISMDLVKVVPDASIPSDYLYAMLRWSGFADAVKQHANGANVLHLNPERITEFVFALAPPDLRAEYGRFSSDVHTEMDALHRKNANLCATRDLLLPKLISGEIDVSDLDIDVGAAEAPDLEPVPA